MQHSRRSATGITLAAVVAIMLLAAGLIAAQDTTPTVAPPTATSPFDFNLPPTLTPLPTGTGIPISLTGVNGYAERDAVVIRNGPGLGFRRISTLPLGQSVDIIGYNGYRLDRPCTANFTADLDMWVLVRFGERTGWIARCTLRITGEFNLVRMLINQVPAGLPTLSPSPTAAG